MITHGITQILQAYFLVGDNPERHLLRSLLLTGSIGHILGEVVAEAVEEAPHTGLAVAATGEVWSCIGGIEGEILVLPLIPAHAAGIAYHIVGTDHQVGYRFLAVQYVFLSEEVLHLHLHIATVQEFSDTALVGMSSDCIVRDAYCHPHSSLL